MQFSFVSKLVAMHRESSPIYDRHVLAFFAKKAPAKSVPNEDRIWVTAEVVSFLRDVAMWNDLTTRGTYGRAQRLKVQFTLHAVDPALILDRRLTFQQSTISLKPRHFDSLSDR